MSGKMEDDEIAQSSPRLRDDTCPDPEEYLTLPSSLADGRSQWIKEHDAMSMKASFGRATRWCRACALALGLALSSRLAADSGDNAANTPTPAGENASPPDTMTQPAAFLAVP